MYFVSIFKGSSSPKRIQTADVPGKPIGPTFKCFAVQKELGLLEI